MGRAILIAESLLALFYRGNSARASHRRDHLYSVCFSRCAADKATIVGLAMVAYPVFAAVGVWRSANARPFQRWPVAAAAAKIGICVVLLASLAA